MATPPDATLGDASFRLVPGDVAVDTLQIAHTHYPTERAERDVNVVLPIERLGDAARAGGIGQVAPHHVSFGFCNLTRELIDPGGGTAHRAAQALVRDEVDLALLVPG